MKKNKSFTIKMTILCLIILLLPAAAGIFAFSALSRGDAALAYANAEAVSELEKLRFDVCALAGILLICIVLFCAVFSVLLSKIKQTERECAELEKTLKKNSPLQL